MTVTHNVTAVVVKTAAAQMAGTMYSAVRDNKRVCNGFNN